MVLPIVLTDEVPKVPNGGFEGFCHYRHLLTLGFSRNTRPYTRHTANFSVVDLYGMMRTKGFAEGLTQGLLDRSCMYGVRGSIPTQPAVKAQFRRRSNLKRR